MRSCSWRPSAADHRIRKRPQIALLFHHHHYVPARRNTLNTHLLAVLEYRTGGQNAAPAPEPTPEPEEPEPVADDNEFEMEARLQRQSDSHLMLRNQILEMRMKVRCARAPLLVSLSL